MIRDLKAFGLVLVAVFAMGTLATSTASAQQGVLTSDGPVTITTEENAGGTNTLTAFGGSTGCPGSPFTGHKYNVTPHTFIPSGSTTATFTPDLASCTTTDASGNKFPTTIELNGCDFVFHIGETTGAANTYGITGTVVCKNAGEHIQVTLFSTAAHSLRVCTLTITVPASGITGAHIIVNTASDDYDLKGTFGTFTAHKSGLCGAGEDKAVKLDIDDTARGKNAAGTPTGITVTD